jgi:hypothetical protein
MREGELAYKNLTSSILEDPASTISSDYLKNETLGLNGFI